MNGVGEPEKVGVGTQFHATRRIVVRFHWIAACSQVIEKASFQAFEIEDGTQMPVGETERKPVRAAQGGDFVTVQADAARVYDFVAVIAGLAGHVLKSVVQADGVVGPDAGEIKFAFVPPLVSQVHTLSQGVGVSDRQELSPAGIDFLVRHACLVVESQSVFEKLVEPGGLVDAVFFLVGRVYPQLIVDFV